MAKSFLKLLIKRLDEMSRDGEIPEKYEDIIRAKIGRLEGEESDHFDPTTRSYSSSWALKMEELQAELAFYHYLFNDQKLLKTVKVLATQQYEPITDFKDEIKELVVYNYVSASREYELLNGVFEEFKKSYFKPVLRRKIIDKYFVEKFYTSLNTYIKDMLNFKLPSLEYDKIRLRENIRGFKKKHASKEYLKELVPIR